MRRVGLTRHHPYGLLARAPRGAGERRDWAALLIDPVEQLTELADLRARGLLSDDEVRQQMAKVIEAY
jgi:hypothetical protein